MGYQGGINVIIHNVVRLCIGGLYYHATQTSSPMKAGFKYCVLGNCIVEQLQGLQDNVQVKYVILTYKDCCQF